MSTKDARETSAKCGPDLEEMSGTTQSFSNLSIARERSDILLLASKIHDFTLLVELLKSSKRYLSRSDRDLMVRALLFYQRREHKDLSKLVCPLRASTIQYISQDTRTDIAGIIEHLFVKYSSEFVNVVPESDDELFGAMIEENRMKQDVWNSLQGMGVVLCNILPLTKKMELVGRKPPEEFFSELTACWKFTNPSKYFNYTGGASMPVGKLDSAGAYVTAGTAVESAGALIDGCVIQNGTVGGLFYCEDDNTMYMVTAGHCVTNDELLSAESTLGDHASSLVVSSEDTVSASYWIEKSPCVDAAIFPLREVTNGILGFNPWFMDDDFAVNEEYFKAAKKLRNPSFDSERDDITVGENFPFIDVRVLHPGTLVVKFGATTGITSGQLIGIRSLTYEEKGVPFAVTDAVVVQWEPGQRFAAGGDSGSVYYAKLGSFTYPIAVHRAQTYIETPNHLARIELGSMVEVDCGSSMWRLGKIVAVNQSTFEVEFDDKQSCTVSRKLIRGGPRLFQNVSIGTPLLDVVKKFKIYKDTAEVTWFRTKLV